MLERHLHLHSVNPPVQTNFACGSAALTCWPGHELSNLYDDLQLQTFGSWNRSILSKNGFLSSIFLKGGKKKYYYLVNLVRQITKLLRDKSQKVPDFHVMLHCWKGVSPLKIGTGFPITYLLFMIWLEEAAPLEITPGTYLLTLQHEHPSDTLSCSATLW